MKLIIINFFHWIAVECNLSRRTGSLEWFKNKSNLDSSALTESIYFVVTEDFGSAFAGIAL